MIRFTVLGAVRAWRDDGELRLGPPQQRAVLALLLAYGGQPASLSELVDLLWAADPPASAVNIVHRYVGALRRVLEPDLPPRAVGHWLIGHAGGYRAEVEAANLDLLRFRELVGQAREVAANGLSGQAAAGGPGKSSAVSLFVEGLGLCQGDCAGDLPDVAGHPAFTAVDQESLAVAREAADVALEAGLAQQVLPALRQAVTRDPLGEPVAARLVLALAAAGHQADALAVYAKTRARLVEQLGIDPGPELRQAHDRVLEAQASSAPRPEAQADSAPRPEAQANSAQQVAPPVIRPAQLPADLPTFTGRRDEVAYVSGLLTSGPHADGTMLIGAIDGMPGSGKTTLAVHLAHQIADHFPDGQLYVNLRGFDPGGVLSSTEALRGFLEALGMPSARIPAGLDGQAALYRSLLSGRRMLVVLDNARDTAHVRPLLPGSPGCMVLVTSRSFLGELVASDGARLLTLDVFSPADAREALSRRLGAGRVAADPAAADEIVSLSGRLPLALALVAARAATHPAFPLTAIAGELRDGHGSLDAFSDTGTPDVRAIFFWSYRMLSAAAARLFRLLSLQCGPDISLAAAVSLGGGSVRHTRALLAELTRARLLTEHRPGRFSFHDLLRSYAFELCSETESEDDRAAAVSRIFDHYLHSAHNSYVLFRPPQQTVSLEPAQPAVQPERPDDYAAALEWFTAEQRVLEAMVRFAAQHRLVVPAWRLAYKMTLFYQRRGFWHDWAATARTALDAAREGGDLTGQAHMHRVLAGALNSLGDSLAALVELERTRELFVRLGYSTEHAYLHSNFGAVLARLGRHEEALAHHHEALELYRAAGLRIGEALAMEGIGSCANRLGHYDQAIGSIMDALRIHQELEDSGGEANSLASLGLSYFLLGDYGRAAGYTEWALQVYRGMGSRADEAEVLVALADIRLAAGESASARASLTEALAIFDELHLPQADGVRDRLPSLGQQRS